MCIRDRGKRTSDHVYIAIMAAVVLLFNDIMYIAVKMVWSHSAYYALICAFPADVYKRQSIS